MKHRKHIAVLTGDLVGSVALGPEKVDQAMAALEQAAKDMEPWIGASLRFSRHRGDGWQVAVEFPQSAIRVALIFRAALRSLGKEFDTYIGLADGVITTPLPDDLNAANDDVFVTSGERLEAMKTDKFSFRMNYGAANPLHGVVLLSDRISQSWTPAQAELIQVVLNPLNRDKTFTVLAQQFEKSRQTIAKSLEAGSSEAIEMALQSVEWMKNNA